MIYDQIVERLLQHFTSGSFETEAAEAKVQFFNDLGDGPGDSEVFELRMSQFLDWYLFSRKLIKQQIPPILWALQSIDFKIEETERIYYANLAEARHSLFEFLKSSKNTLYIKDLFTGKKLQLVDSPVIEGFNKNDIFETRVFPHEDTFVLTKGFCFHPVEANKFILKEIKRAKKKDLTFQEELMFNLMKMRYKYDRYRHIPLEMIYTKETKLKF